MIAHYERSVLCIIIHDKFRLDQWIRGGGGLKKGAKKIYRFMGVCDEISVRIFFFDKAKRQRFILQNEALALVELKRRKKLYCANAPEVQKSGINNWSALFQKWLCAPCNWHSTWREVCCSPRKLLVKNGTSSQSWSDIQVSSLRLVLKGKQRRLCS